jgi:hypothetical protein
MNAYVVGVLNIARKDRTIILSKSLILGGIGITG